MSLHPNWLSISSATDVMEYKVDLTTARSEDKADQYSSIVIMTGLGYSPAHNTSENMKVRNQSEIFVQKPHVTV